MMGFVPKEDGFVPVSKIEFRNVQKKTIEFRCAEFLFQRISIEEFCGSQ